jgi:hypothetical protein
MLRRHLRLLHRRAPPRLPLVASARGNEAESMTPLFPYLYRHPPFGSPSSPSRNGRLEDPPPAAAIDLPHPLTCHRPLPIKGSLEHRIHAPPPFLPHFIPFAPESPPQRAPSAAASVHHRQAATTAEPLVVASDEDSATLLFLPVDLWRRMVRRSGLATKHQ